MNNLYTHDCGDFIVVINLKYIMITSDRLESNKLTHAHHFCLCVLDSYSKYTKTGTPTNVSKVFLIHGKYF